MGSGGVVAVLFGGRDATGAVLADTWWLHPSTTSWTLLAGGPAARVGGVFAHGLTGVPLVLFGGRDASGGVLGDTWSFDPSAVPQWQQVTTAVAPPPRTGHAMAGFGDANRGVVLFGGVDAAGNLLDDTWVLTRPPGGAPQWAVASPAARPSPRRDHAMVGAWHRGRVQLFGGEDATGVRGDSWEWDGTTWTAMITVGSPTPRAGASFVDARQYAAPAPWQGTLFGGRDGGGQALGDTWQVRSTAPATTSSFASFPPGITLQAFGPPWLPSAFTVQLGGLVTMYLPHLIAGFSNTTSSLGPLPLSLGPALHGAVLLVDPVVLLPFPGNGVSFTTQTIGLPPTPALAGTRLYLQGIAWTLGFSGGQWLVSNGLDCQLGWL